MPYRDEAFLFGPLTAAELADFVRRGKMLAAVRGIGAAGPTLADAVWRIADPSLASFASAVPEAAVADPNCFVAREKSALALVDRV